MLSIKKKEHPNFFAILMRYSILVALILIINTSKVYCQKIQIPDSLKNKSYKELYAGFNNHVNDSTINFIYSSTYLRKAKKENDTLRIAHAYSQFASIALNEKESIKYCDSIINISINSENSQYPGHGYLCKGMNLFYLGNYKKALENYLLAFQYAKKYKNTEQLLYIKNSIGNLKFFLKDYRSALDNFKYTLRILNQQNKTETFNRYSLYSNTLFNLSNSYILIQKFDSAQYYIDIGILKTLRNNDTLRYSNFVFQSGIIAYHHKNYENALDSLNKALPYESSPNGFLNDHYYRGKIYCKLKNEPKAFYHFKKADSIYNSTNDVVPEVRDIQEFFVSFYRKKKDLKSELFYINRLLKVDSILSSTNHFLNEKITKKYDVPNLISEKEKIINSLKNEERNSTVLISTLFIVIVLSIPVLFTFYKKQKKYKYELNQIDLNKANKKTNTDLNGISSKIIENVLSQLDDFEKKNDFLDNNLTLNILSKKLNTNSNYLSKIINHHKKMNFSSYISNLRIAYCIEKLKSDSKFRRFTIHGIAFEIGFNNVESFSKAFHKKTDTYPSSFIKEIEEKSIV